MSITFYVKAQELTFDVTAEYFPITANTTFNDYTQGGITIGGGASGSIARVDGDYKYIEIGKGTAKYISITSVSDIKKITIYYRGAGNSTESNPIITYGNDASATNTYTDNSVKTTVPGAEKSFVFPANTKYIRISNGLDATDVNATTRVYKIIAGFSEYTLPLNFLSFTAKPNNQNSSVTLNWQTTNEVNTKEFVIERRTESTEFKPIDTKVSNNTSGVHHYTYTDYNALSGKAYYRLKQLDHDAKYQYSDVVVAELKKGPVLSVYPNPAQDVLNVQIGDKSITALQILNTHGQKVLSIHVSEEESSKAINITSLNAGAYILQQVAGTIVKDRYKFIKE
ncbi:T9SS type A sorting domain-containing protein [Pseudopedobacter beijingensis]|uniref:T9SS type A sorting domain-containing protein n=1 Tax=Pseudopedobacter beijingensis TaxID=1207056 RepID=A0ABW4IB48_9SPHI